MTADIPSVLSKDGTDGLGAVPSVLEESRTDGTVDNTGPRFLALSLPSTSFSSHPSASSHNTIQYTLSRTMAAIVGKEARYRPQYIGRVPSTSRRTAHSVRVEENMGSSFSEVSLVVFSLLCSSSKPELSSKNPDAESSLGMDLVSPFSSFCHYCANFLKEESSLKNLGPEG